MKALEDFFEDEKPGNEMSDYSETENSTDDIKIIKEGDFNLVRSMEKEK